MRACMILSAGRDARRLAAVTCVSASPIKEDGGGLQDCLVLLEIASRGAVVKEPGQQPPC